MYRNCDTPLAARIEIIEELCPSLDVKRLAHTRSMRTNYSNTRTEKKEKWCNKGKHYTRINLRIRIYFVEHAPHQLAAPYYIMTTDKPFIHYDGTVIASSKI